MDKRCTQCDEVKPLDEYYWDSVTKSPRAACKECTKAKAREYVLKNPGKTARDRKRMSKEQRRIRDKREGEQKRNRRKRVPEALSRAVRKAYPECCACGSVKQLGVDHITPVSEGGTDDWDNLQTLCATCNSRKRFKIIDYRDPVQPDPRV